MPPPAQVRHQRTLWERSLELRILLQKPLAGGNRMPRPAVQQAVLALDQGLRQQYSQLHTAAAETLQLLLQLQSALVDNNPAITAAAGQQEQQQQGSKAGSKRSRQATESGPPGCSALWSQVEAGQARCAAFCEQSLDKWHRRAVLSSGSAVLRNSLRALNQSISSQVRGRAGQPGSALCGKWCACALHAAQPVCKARLQHLSPSQPWSAALRRWRQ